MFRSSNMQLSVVVLGVAALCATVSAIDVPVSTKYRTTEVTTLAQKSTVTLIGYLCGLGKGSAINITMVLNNNPKWSQNQGVINYYAVDSPSKTEKDALCTNVVQFNAGPYCTVKAWPSVGDLYIKGTAGPVEAISFSLDAEIFRKVESIPEKAGTLPPAKHLPPDVSGPKLRDHKTVYLTEFITLTASQAIPRLQEAHLNFSFCPSPETGSRYTITSTVFGIDGQSSWAQYICDKSPCELSHPDNIVVDDGRELPSNTVTTPSGQWRQMYALIVCWGGPYDPKSKQFIGHFQFNAVVNKSPTRA